MILLVGSRGDDVKTLQASLKSRGFYAGALDGEFGPATDAAVRAFQKAAGLDVDGVAGAKTLAAVLSPVVMVQTGKFPPAVAQWASPIMRVQANLPDPVAVEDALRWIQLESGGNPAATGRILGDLVMEAGLSQAYFETKTSTVAGFTSKQLRDLCGAVGTSQHCGKCSDEAMLALAQVAVVDIKAHRSRARARLAAAGLHVDEATRDFRCYWKLTHALPGLYSYLRTAMLAVGTMMTWADFRRWVESASVQRLTTIDAGTARYSGQFKRVFENCERFAS